MCIRDRCLLHVVPIIKLEHDEINNIIVMSRLLYYLDSISSLNKKLSIDQWNGCLLYTSLKNGVLGQYIDVIESLRQQEGEEKEPEYQLDLDDEE